MNVVIIRPKKLSDNIINSQVLPILKYLELMNYNVKLCTRESNYIGYADVIYTRDIFDFISLKLKFLFKIKKPLFVHDFRALVSYESFYRNKSTLKKLCLISLEFFVYFYSDYIFCVSNNIKKELNDIFYNKNIFVIPCCYNGLHSFSSDSKANDFVYLGGLSKWQRVEDILGIVKSNKIQNEFSLVTNQIEEAQKLINKKDLKNVNLFSVNGSEVFEKISNYKYGFLIRDDSIINKLASPIKFLEYISLGVIPIVYGSVGDFSSHPLFPKLCIKIDNLNVDLLDVISRFNHDEYFIYRKKFLNEYNFYYYYHCNNNPWNIIKND